MAKRHVAPMALPEVAPGDPATAAPEMTWIAPEDLVVDDVYQRDLSEKSVGLIRKIVAGWDWRRFKPPVCAWTAEGLEVIDGQHTAIAAATHPAIAAIPILVVAAEDQQERASAFIGHNRDRVAITAPQLHAAAVAAGDERALAVEEVCKTVGVRIMRMPPPGGQYQPRQTIAVSTIGSLVSRRGADHTRAVLGIAVEAGFAPITAAQIKAIDHLLTAPEFEGLDPETLGRAIQMLGYAPAERDAKAFSATHCQPMWRGLAATWFKAAKKRRPPAADRSRIEAPAVPVRRSEVGADGIKRDERPAAGAWAPGRFLRRCRSCDERFMGAQAATSCADCAHVPDEEAA